MPQNAAAEFGADTLPQAAPTPPPRSPLESITAQVTDFRFDARGHFIVTLSNGQEWQQIEGDTANVPLRKSLTHTATISRPALWSYSIHFDNPAASSKSSVHGKIVCVRYTPQIRTFGGKVPPLKIVS